MDAARGLLGMLENPGVALRAMIDWEDLESGHPGRWAGHMLPGVLLGAVTDGAGFFIRAARLLHRFALEAEALRDTRRTLAGEIGEGDAQLLVTQLGGSTTDELLRAMMPSEIRRFTDELGATRVRDLAQRYGAQSMAFYGVEFFKEYRGVTADTMKHVVTNDGIRKGEILGCHDGDAFRQAISGIGEIVSEEKDPVHPDITRVRYKLYRRKSDGSLEQPARLSTGRPRKKTLVLGMARDVDRWRTLAEKAADNSIRDMRLPKSGGEFEALTEEGVGIRMYYRFPKIDTFFPK